MNGPLALTQEVWVFYQHPLNFSRWVSLPVGKIPVLSPLLTQIWSIRLITNRRNQGRHKVPLKCMGTWGSSFIYFAKFTLRETSPLFSLVNAEGPGRRPGRKRILFWRGEALLCRVLHLALGILGPWIQILALLIETQTSQWGTATLSLTFLWEF